MANSRYEYIKQFERNDQLPLESWLIVRVDGHAFHRFTSAHAFLKPNDRRGLSLMNTAARAVMHAFPEVRLGYGSSDEYSFLFPPNCARFNRRESKLLSTVVSIFTGAYIFHWPKHFLPSSREECNEGGQAGEHVDLKYAPSFDGRVVVYPNAKLIRDYFSWRQVDTHINNLYNTTFWSLVQRDPSSTVERVGRYSNAEAEARLKGTFAKDKNEILWREYGLNYNSEPAMFKKGSSLFYANSQEEVDRAVVVEEDPDLRLEKREKQRAESAARMEKERRTRGVQEEYVDLITDAFWDRHPHILHHS